MAHFRYKAKKGPNDVLTGVLEAENERAASAQLRALGYFPLTIDEDTEQDKKESLRKAFVRIRLKDRNLFFRQLANLMEAGMPITRALNTLVKQTQNSKMVAIIRDLLETVQKGSNFAEALERHPSVFPSIHVNLVRAGETGGMMEDVLWRIVEFGEQEEELKGKAISALVYPLFLLCIGTIAIFILVSFVFPKFVAIFEDFNATLPWPTLLVMGLCEFMGSFWWAVLLGAGAVVALFMSYARTERGQMQLDRTWLKVPVIGGVVLRYEMAKFARTLGTLFDNGVPVLTALRITSDTLGNRAVSEEVDYIHGAVTEGESISESMTSLKHFPPMVVSMIAIGEESGRLGSVTKRIADAYDTEVDRAVTAMSALFEPILIVVMGVIVGFLVIAMLLPMLTLSSNVG